VGWLVELVETNQPTNLIYQEKSMNSNQMHSGGAMKLTDAQWNELQSQLQQHWGELDEQALQATHGDLDKLVGLIAQQTGESRQMVETTLQQLIDREPESEGSAGARDFVR
jgi:uncharacterized protein YjbJ (UPF0337 family)